MRGERRLRELSRRRRIRACARIHLLSSRNPTRAHIATDQPAHRGSKRGSIGVGEAGRDRDLALALHELNLSAFRCDTRRKIVRHTLLKSEDVRSGNGHGVA